MVVGCFYFGGFIVDGGGVEQEIGVLKYYYVGGFWVLLVLVDVYIYVVKLGVLDFEVGVFGVEVIFFFVVGVVGDVGFVVVVEQFVVCVDVYQ